TVLWPVSGGAAIPVGGLSPDETLLQISADGESLYVLTRFVPGARKVWLQELRTGRRRLWKEISGADRAQRLTSLFVTPSCECYAYGTSQSISTAYVIDGLR